MIMSYCEVCGKEVETKVVTRKEVLNVCGEDIEVVAQVLVCAVCGEELFNEEYDSATLIKAYNEYRRRHKLLLPKEIAMIREQYGLSQRSFAKLLNWGDKTIRRYENGSIQDSAHNSLLLFLRDPRNMRTYITENEVSLDEKQKEKLLKTVEEMEQDPKYRGGSNYHSTTARALSEENGFKEFDYEKLCAMVLFFAQECSELLKTKLMKLLNYADMVFYKENGISMSGLKYVHLPYGPVPDHIDMILARMVADHMIRIKVSYDGAYEKHQILPERDVPEGVLSDTECKVLSRVYEKFKDFGSAEISEYSHKEKGYNATKQGEIISYAYAMDIQLD